MDQLTTQKDGVPFLKKLKKGITKKKVIAVCVIIALAVGGKWGWTAAFGTKAEAVLNTATVTRGDISVSISGTGTIEPIEEYKVVPLVKGDILADNFAEGDTIEKGSLLYQIDTKDVENSIEKAMLSLQKSQFTHEQNVEAVNNQNVTSPLSGLVTNVYVKEGDNVQNNGKIADVVDNSALILQVPFNSEDVRNVSPGDQATVNLASSFTSVEGTVVRISTGERVLDGYITVKDVEVKITNPGALSDTDVASAIIGGADCAEPGTLRYADSKTIMAKTSGEVKEVNFYAGDTISQGQVLARLENESAQLNRDTSALNVQDAELALQNLYDQQAEYNITSPISGTVIQKSYKAGDTIDNTSASVVLAIVADMSQFTFTINVDELDISKIKVGQEVAVTADALPNKNFTGIVDNISVVGTTTSGVATYPVKVLLDAQEGLLPGMNVSAEIVVEESTDTLMVPIDAVNRGNIVYVKDDGTERSNKVSAQSQASGSGQQKAASNGNQQAANKPAASSNAASGSTSGNAATTPNNSQKGNAAQKMAGVKAPDGYIAVVVTTGVNDDSYIEISDGLKEGDTIIVTAKASTATSQFQQGIPGGQGGMVVATGPRPSGAQSGSNVGRIGG